MYIGIYYCIILTEKELIFKSNDGKSRLRRAAKREPG